MNMSLQVGRGVAALALCIALGGFAATHPGSAGAATSTAPKNNVAPTTTLHVAKAHSVHDKKQRCEVALPSIEIGAPIAVTIDGAPLAQATR